MMFQDLHLVLCHARAGGIKGARGVVIVIRDTCDYTKQTNNLANQQWFFEETGFTSLSTKIWGCT